MLGQQAVDIAQIAKETGLTRQTVYRIKNDPAGAEEALGRRQQLLTGSADRHARDIFCKRRDWPLGFA